MTFQIGSTLLDACVLAVLAGGDAYGYRLTQQLRQVVDISESTLYPVLRRLQKDEAVQSYDQPYMGRNRRYYRLTDKGNRMYQNYQEEWNDFRRKIDSLMLADPLLQLEAKSSRQSETEFKMDVGERTDAL